jgi:hypothetical protein
MSTGRDDDALTWGDDDPTLDAGERSRPRDKRRTPTPVPAEPVKAVERDDTNAPGLGNVGLVVIGMIAMAYILFAVGWLIAGVRLYAEFAGQPAESLAVSAFTVMAIAVAAAVGSLVWFVAALALTKGRPVWVRFAWLIGGLVLLVPWPFLVTGALR